MKALRYLLGALGLAGVGYGLYGVLTDSGTRPVAQLGFLLTVLIGHDLVWMPFVIGVGFVVAHWAPPWSRGPAYAALYASAAVSIVALPFVLGYGRKPDDPSALPLHYGRGLVVALAAIWLVAAVTALARRLR